MKNPTVFILVTLLLSACSPREKVSSDYTGSWAQVEDILASVNPPEFPDRDFSILDYGAKAGGLVDSRAAIMDAIAACHDAGGGRVVIPAGTYLCDGPIHLESNIDFHLSKDSEIRFGSNYSDYLPAVLTRWEGTRVYGYSPFVYAFQKTNVALTGTGTLDGQAKETWAKWTDGHDADKELNREMNQTRVPLEERQFGEGRKLRPPMIQFYECENILVEEVRIIDSPFWCVHTVFSRNITVRNITFTAMNPNNDGIDIDSCEDVYIHDVIFANHDDNVVIKSGRDTEGRDLGIPTRNVYVRDCVFNAYTGVAIGSEMSGSIYNIFVEDCHAESMCKRGLNIKGNRDRGGEVAHIRFRNIQFEDVSREMFVMSGDYGGENDNNFPPYYHDIRWEDCSGTGSCRIGLKLTGQADLPIENVVLKNISVDKAEVNSVIEHVDGLITQKVRMVDQHLVNFENLPPDVYAGPDQVVSGINASVLLEGTVADDGATGVPMTYQWSVIQGDARSVKFDAVESLKTTASFTAEGLYVLKLTANDSELDGYHFLIVEVGKNAGGIAAVTKPIFQHSGTHPGYQ